MKIITKFQRGYTSLTHDIKEYTIFDEKEDYFSMIPFKKENCVNGVTILEISRSNGGQDTKVVDEIPNNIEGMDKIF